MMSSKLFVSKSVIMERKGFILRPKFIFIDGRTGATMYSESYREEILYNSQQNTPALSSYFELMDAATARASSSGMPNLLILSPVEMCG